LALYFGEQRSRTCLLRQREAGELADGNAGRNGSAPVTPHQAAFAVLMLALDNAGDAFEAVNDARRIAAFKLLRHDETRGGGEPTIKTPFGNQHLDLLTAIALDIERFDEDRVPASWAIAAQGACQVRPDRLVFGPSLEALTDP